MKAQRTTIHARSFHVPSIAQIKAILAERRNAAMRADELTSRDSRAHHGFDPNQPRVPAGNPHGGEWTNTRSDARVELAAAEKPPPFGPGLLRLLAAALFAAIKAFRWKYLRDMFGHTGDDVVAATTVDGEEIFGVNSESRLYTDADDREARKWRDTLVRKYPEVMKPQPKIGQMPNNALFHAEATVLLRAATKSGGTLAGRTLVVAVDKAMCPSCEKVLPKLAFELGNPTVHFVDRAGRILATMKDGN